VGETMDGGFRLPFRHNGTSCVPEKLHTCPLNHTTRWSRPSGSSHGTNVTLLKPAKHYQSFQSPTGPWRSHLEKQTWLSIAILLWCLDIVWLAIKLVNKWDSNSCAYMVDFPRLSHICEELLYKQTKWHDAHLITYQYNQPNF